MTISKDAQILSLKTELELANNKIAELEKNIANLTTTKDCYWRQYQEKENELTSTHDFLNALPNPPPRKQDPEKEYSKDLSLIVRFCLAMMSK